MAATSPVAAKPAKARRATTKTAEDPLAAAKKLLEENGYRVTKKRLPK
jgi:hypothetical protein